MRQFSLFILLVALFAAGCTSSTTVLGDPAAELARVDPDGEVAAQAAEPTPTPVVDPDWAKPARPIPTPEPTPTAAPTATTVPVTIERSEDSDESVTPEPTPTPSFEELVENSIGAIANSGVVQVVMNRSIGPGAHNDYSSSTGIIIDRLSGVRRAVVSLSGAGWDGLAARNGLERLRTGDRYEFLLADDDVYMSAQPALRTLPAGTSWLIDSRSDFESEQLTQFDAVVITDPGDVIDGLLALLQFDGEPRKVNSSTYRLDVPNADLLKLAPGAGVLSLVALGQVANQNPDFEAFAETSPVRLSFTDGLLTDLTIDLAPVFAELPNVGGTNDFDGIEILETYSLTFGSTALLSLPDADDLADPTDLYRDLQQVGTCFGLTDDTYSETSCEEKHLWEVIETGRFDDDYNVAFPGNDQLFARRSDGCSETVEALLDISLGNTSLIVDVRTPSATSWADGDRQYACVLKFAEPVNVPLDQVDLAPYQNKATRFTLEVGQCVEAAGLGALHFDIVDCEEPHYYEVYLIFPVQTDTDTFPGADVVDAQANARCVNYIEGRTSADDLQLEWQVQALVPSADTWISYDERRVVCMATTEQLETGRTFTSSLVVTPVDDE